MSISTSIFSVELHVFASTTVAGEVLSLGFRQYLHK